METSDQTDNIKRLSDKNKNERCKQLISSVENVSQNEIEEIFKMIHSHGCDYTRNNNGLFINLTWIPDELLEELEQYVKFCNRSQTELKKYESICDVLNIKLREDSSQSNKNKLQIVSNTLISKSNTTSIPPVNTINSNDIHPNIDETMDSDIIPLPHSNEEAEVEAAISQDIEKISKVSSSMKFAILKKRYSKIGIINTNNIENDLKKEHFYIV
jgi:hypothetical protein